MNAPKQQGESMEVSIASRSGQAGWHLLKVVLLAGTTVFSTWAGIRESVFTRAAIAVPEPMTLAMFGGVLIPLGLLLRHRPFQGDSAQSNRGRGTS